MRNYIKPAIILVIILLICFIVFKRHNESDRVYRAPDKFNSIGKEIKRNLDLIDDEKFNYEYILSVNKEGKLYYHIRVFVVTSNYCNLAKKKLKDIKKEYYELECKLTDK